MAIGESNRRGSNNSVMTNHLTVSRLKLEVVVAKPYTSVTTTTSLVLPKELPSVEEALKLLAAISGLSGTVLGLFVGQKA